MNGDGFFWYYFKKGFMEMVPSANTLGGIAALSVETTLVFSLVGSVTALCFYLF